MPERRGDLWLILALVGVALLLGFCAWGVHFTPDMNTPPGAFDQIFGTATLCGGPFLLLLAVFCFVIRM